MGSTRYSWNDWGDLLVADKNTEVLATYNNQFYSGMPAVVTRKAGKGSVTYIGVNTDDSRLEKDVLRAIYEKAGAVTEDYPKGVYVYWRDGFFVAVNYSSESYTMNIPEKGKVLVGEKTLRPAGVVVWTE